MKKILLVDDKATIGRVLKIYLGTEYDLEYFESPLKALEWLNEGNVPDLIISDIHMPHMRGNEFLSIILMSFTYKDEKALLAERNKK
jgi:CheY-like chemotaxis protein